MYPGWLHLLGGQVVHEGSLCLTAELKVILYLHVLLTIIGNYQMSKLFFISNDILRS